MIYAVAAIAVASLGVLVVIAISLCKAGWNEAHPEEKQGEDTDERLA